MNPSFIDKAFKTPIIQKKNYRLFDIDVLQSPYFEIIFISFIPSAWDVVYSTSISDTLFLSIGINLQIQLKVLKKKLRNINRITSTNDLILLILEHKLIISHFENFLKLFTEILVVQIYTYTIIICFSTFRLGDLSFSETEQILTIVPFLLTVVTSLSIYCYVGSEIADEVRCQLLKKP